MAPPAVSDTLTPAQAALILGVSKGTVIEWAKAGLIPHAKIRRTYRFSEGALRDLLTRQVAEERRPCLSTSAKAPRTGGPTSVLSVNLDVDSQLTQLIERRRNASTTSTRRNSGLQNRLATSTV
jgi:excisionase family DNA binding protein